MVQSHVRACDTSADLPTPPVPKTIMRSGDAMAGVNLGAWAGVRGLGEFAKISSIALERYALLTGSQL